MSGNLALDFTGTLKWRRSEPEELLEEPKDLVRWAEQAGVVSTPFDIRAGEFDDLLTLRESIYRLVTAHLSGKVAAPADVGRLNRALACQPPRLRYRDGHLTRTGSASSVAASIATGAAELLAGEETDRVKECGRDECTRYFVDRSRGGTRTWCGMEECGNRIKAANYRSRRRSRTGPRMRQG